MITFFDEQCTSKHWRCGKSSQDGRPSSGQNVINCPLQYRVCRPDVMKCPLECPSSGQSTTSKDFSSKTLYRSSQQQRFSSQHPVICCKPSVTQHQQSTLERVRTREEGDWGKLIQFILSQLIFLQHTVFCHSHLRPLRLRHTCEEPPMG